MTDETIGQARHTPMVEVEIRAAEIAAGYVTATIHPLMGLEEVRGWNRARRGVDPLDDSPHPITEYVNKAECLPEWAHRRIAGWLAYQIVHHDEIVREETP